MKLRKSHPDLGDYTVNALQKAIEIPKFLASLSYGTVLPNFKLLFNVTYFHTLSGGLTTPSEDFQVMGGAMEAIFVKIQGKSGFNLKKGAVQSLVAAVLESYPNFDAEVVKTYIKIRTIVRMRYENLKAEELLSITRTENNVTKRSKSSKRPNGDAAEPKKIEMFETRQEPFDKKV